MRKPHWRVPLCKSVRGNVEENGSDEVIDTLVLSVSVERKISVKGVLVDTEGRLCLPPIGLLSPST